jgi:transitional endoplasmic reticulum ATPase
MAGRSDGQFYFATTGIIEMSEESIQALRVALQVSPKNLPLRLLLARSLEGLQQFEDAAGEFLQCLAIDKSADGARLGLARCTLQGGKVDEALRQLDSITADDPYCAEAYLWLARGRLRCRDREAARRAYETAIQLDPSLKSDALSEELSNEEEVPEKIALSLHDGEAKQEDLVEVKRPTQSFVDVGGLEALKERIRMDIILPFQQPEMFRAYGKKIGGGILLYGPPGCGKTHIARATAGEVKARFISVMLDDILDMYLGQGEKRLAAVFRKARQETPAIIFIDEIDALGGKRKKMHHGSGRTLVSQLLTEMDGAGEKNSEILVVGATNAPWDVDGALKRPGRFDRVIFVAPPDRAARKEILQIFLLGKPVGDVDRDWVASKTRGFSGADLNLLVDIAIELALAEAMKSGQLRPLETNHFKRAMKKAQPTTEEWLRTARNYARYSNESGAYDEIQNYLDGPKD